MKEQHIKEPSACKQLLIDSIKAQMNVGETAYEFENRQSVVLVIGVNGVGKTTSIGKLAGKLKDQGKKVILAAADTFRAAAGEQLTEWAHRAGVEIIPDRKDRIRQPLYTMRSRHPKHVMQMYCSAIRQDDFIIKRILWQSWKNQPCDRPGISGSLPRNTGCAGRYNRSECTCTGKTIFLRLLILPESFLPNWMEQPKAVSPLPSIPNLVSR